MSSTTLPMPLSRAAGFYSTPIGKKVVMAITGMILFGFVIGHMLGNLQIFLGAEKLDAYGALLHSMPGLLWAARITLLGSVGLHILAAAQLTRQNRAARPVSYVRKEAVTSTYASRTMLWSGPIIAAFVIYHLLHFTTGTVHPQFQELKVFHNVTTGFKDPLVSGFYILSMLLLGMHLYHGAWSMFQSLGFAHPRFTPKLRAFAAVSAAAIVIGNISIPIAVLTGLVG